MKKILSLITLLFISIIIIYNNYFAVAYIDDKNTESLLSDNQSIISNDYTIYFDDGSFIRVETFSENVSTVLLSTIPNETESYIKKGTKNVTMYRSNGTMLWNYYLTGDFEIIPGVSATALNSSYEVTNKSSGWKFSNGSSYTNGNRVEGRGTFKHVVLFITIKTVTIEINLAADSSGNIK